MIFAAALAGPRTEKALSTEFKKKDGVATVTLSEGFHFNTKAPHRATVDGKMFSPVKSEAKGVWFEGLPKEFGQGQLTVFVCDDAETFCEASRVALQGEGVATPAAAPAKEPAVESVSAHSEVKLNRYGFIENDLSAAMAQAQKEKKLILVDFGAPWCPGCVRLDQEVIASKEFAKMAAAWVKVKIDTDRLENNVVADKYAVKGIPALITLTSAGEEIERLVDYQPLSRVRELLRSAKSDATPLKDLVAKTAKSQSSAVLLRAGKRLAAAESYKAAAEILSRVKPPPKEFLPIKVLATKDLAKKEREAILRSAIKAEPESSRSLGWRAQLLEIVGNKEERDEIRDEGLEVADAMLKDEDELKDATKSDDLGEFAGYPALKVAVSRVELLTAAKAPAADIQAAWKVAAEVGKNLKIPYKKVGPSMRYVWVLMQGKQFAAADRILAKLLEADPKNSELLRRRLKSLTELQKFEEAIPVGQEALSGAYGRNEYFVVETLAKAYVGAKKMSDARQLLDTYLQKPDVDWPEMKEIRRSLEALRKQAEGGAG